MKKVREVRMAFDRMFHACSEAEKWLEKLGVEYTLDIHQQMPRDVYSMSIRVTGDILSEVAKVDPHYYMDDGVVLMSYPTNFGQVPITISY